MIDGVEHSRSTTLDQGSRGCGAATRGGQPSTAADELLRPAGVPGARAAVDDLQVEGLRQGASGPLTISPSDS